MARRPKEIFFRCTTQDSSNIPGIWCGTSGTEDGYKAILLTDVDKAEKWLIANP